MKNCSNENCSFMKGLGVIGFLIFGVLWFIFLLGSFFVIKPGQRAVMTIMWNMQKKVYSDGFYLKLPFISGVHKYSIQNIKQELDASASSKDLQAITAKVSINYSLQSDKIPFIYSEVWNHLDVQNKIVEPSIQESIKASVAKFTAEELITKRSLLAQDILQVVKWKIEAYGINVLAINIVDFTFSDQFKQAIEAKVVAEQEALAEKNKLEKVKFEAQQQVETAKAEAQKIKIQAEAIQKQWGAEYVQLQWISKRNGQLPQMMAWEKTSMLFYPWKFQN